MTKYRLLIKYGSFPKDAIVYTLAYSDFGAAKNLAERDGDTYVSVTLDPTGNYPFITVQRAYLKQIKD